MQPAPIPPNGIATGVALSPLKVRCGPLRKSSSGEKGDPSDSGKAEVFDTAAAGGGRVNGTAAPKAAEEVVTRNSLRVDLSEDIKAPPPHGLVEKSLAQKPSPRIAGRIGPRFARA